MVNLLVNISDSDYESLFKIWHSFNENDSVGRMLQAIHDGVVLPDTVPTEELIKLNTEPCKISDAGMGLRVIAKFFRDMSDETLLQIFGTVNLPEIFDTYDDETVKLKIEDYVRKLYDNTEVN